MQSKAAAIFTVVCLLAILTFGKNKTEPDAPSAEPVELARYQEQFSNAHLEPAYINSTPGVAIIFEGTDDLHYYARAKTAPAPGFELKVEAKSDTFSFGKPVFPKWKIFRDPTGSDVEVYVGHFIVFMPITSSKTNKGDVEVKITGIACTSQTCLPPFEKILITNLDWGQRDLWKAITLEPADRAVVKAFKGPTYHIWSALLLAFLAGVCLNIMPCVWPVLPLIVMRIIKQAKESKGKSVALGLNFCLGILLFFVCLAGANIILKSFYNTTLSWGDHLRNPVIAIGLSLLMIVMALFMFGVFTITIPSSIASKSGSGKGYVGSIGMGFLAAILSTPCSFGILTVAFVWAQGQHLALGTVAIMIIGIGMAVPYAILTSMPGLLNRLPSAGRWMELFKQTLGFILLLIAVKLIKGIPDDSKINVLYFAVVLSFCIWMWFNWVSYGSKLSRKVLVRTIAVILLILSFWFLSAQELVDWQSYDADLIEKSISENRPVLIDFTAGWCTNCEVIDRLVYQRKDIAELIKQKEVLAIKADTTENDSPATLALKNIYNEPGVPVSMLFVPDREEPLRWRGILFANELKKSLENLPSRKK